MKHSYLPILFLLLSGCSEKKIDPKNIVAGYTSIHFVDQSRIYKTGSIDSSYLHYRPIDLDVWYPAERKGADTLLQFKDLLGKLESRSLYYTASTTGAGLTGQIAKSICDQLKCSDSLRLLQYKTSSYQHARAADSKFPLVVYLSSFNGMCFENFPLFEQMTKEGYVVICISSIGRYPGDMTMKYADLMEQVYDAAAAIRYAKNNLNIDSTKIALMGYSWGGLAATLLTNEFPKVECLISLEGSEFHHYGTAKDEDADFDSIANSDSFKKMAITMPYLRFESNPIPQSNKKDSVYPFTKKLKSGSLILKIDSAKHEDLCCIGDITNASGQCPMHKWYGTLSKLCISYLNDHLKEGKRFSQDLGTEMYRTVRPH